VVASAYRVGIAVSKGEREVVDHPRTRKVLSVQMRAGKTAPPSGFRQCCPLPLQVGRSQTAEAERTWDRPRREVQQPETNPTRNLSLSCSPPGQPRETGGERSLKSHAKVAFPLRRRPAVAAP
jgi:hypothetical protein